ncbi:MAG: S-layer homology domain-containing protein [Clostridia bacterium]|nr:S-layer homology domain-containing protein [Clostridia bacterium]
MKGKKITALLLLFALCLTAVAVPAAEANNILKNGGFEEIASNGVPTGWGLSGAEVGNGFEVVSEGASEGKNAIHFKSSGDNMYVSNMMYVKGGTEYEFKAKLKRKNTTDGPQIKLTWQAPDGKGSYTTLEDKGYGMKVERQNVWGDVSQKAKAPDDATRLIILVRLIGAGEVWWDDIQIIGEAGSAASAQTAAPAPALPAPADDAYEVAQVSADQKISITSVGENKFNLLKNGDFETVASTGLPTGWGLTGGQMNANYMTAKGDAQSGDNFVRFFGESSAIFVSNMITNVVAETEYIFSGYIRKISGGGDPMVTFVCQTPAGNTHADVKTIYANFAPKKTGEWEKVEYKLAVPATTTRISCLVRLTGGGELHWDNLSFVGEASGASAKAVMFTEQLAKEAAVRPKVEAVTYGDETAELPAYAGQPENLAVNGSFDENDGSQNVNGWILRSDFASAGLGSVAKGEGYDGGDAIRLKSPDDLSTKHPFYKQTVYTVGGAEYQVSYRYKILKGEGCAPTVKLEFSADRSLPGAVSCGEKYCGPTETVRDGEWHYVVRKAYPTANVAEIDVLARLMQNKQGEECEILIDDLKICMTTPPFPLDLETSSIFFYEDETEGTFSTSANLAFYPDLANVKVDYRLYKDGSVIWESLGHISEEGKTSVPFDVSILTEKEVPYTLKATMYDASGAVKAEKLQDIFLYARPEYLGADGIYMKEGKEPFYPVYAYHVNGSHYDDVAAAGINLVQMGAFDNADQALAALDKAQEAGIMGFFALYYGMKPAGHESNIERTIRILSDERVQNHPALFGYGVMDEVFLGLSNPEQDLENSFRLLRMLDPKRPIMTMEAVGTYYEKCAKYVDILCIDPYSAASGQRASIATTAAREAVNYKKPVYTLLEAYYNTHGRWPTPEDGRNNNWQALIAGADCVGYYSISDSDLDPATGKMSVPIMEARDGGALWNALLEFGTVEKKIAYDHFVFDKSPEFNQYLGEDHWYSSWVADGGVYMIVLGMKDGQTLPVSIPLESFAGDIKIGAYTAEIIAGRTDKTPVSGNGTLDMTISGVEAVLYKITPSEPVDFSALGITSFDDLETHNWARQQIAMLDARGIVDGRSDWEYAPGENVTRAELAAFLVRTLGLTNEGGENFADVPATHAYAKELAQGKAAGIINGIGDNMYNPDANITRQELMTMISRGLQLTGEADISAFTDNAAVADWALTHVKTMIASGLIKGNADGTLNPLGNTTRAEAAVIMDRILKR